MPQGPNESAAEITQPIAVQREPGETTQALQPADIANVLSRAPLKKPADLGPQHEILARANLLRIRKQFPEAIILCEEALSQWPRSVEANALLGDIHADEGRVDDAILRYCRVLESDPRNARGRTRLTQLVGLKRQQLSGRVPGIALPPLRADRLVRVVTLGIATLMLLTILATPLIIRQRQQSVPSPVLDRGRDITVKPVYLVPVPPPAPPTPAQPNPTAAPIVNDSHDSLALRAPLDHGVVDILDSDRPLLGKGVQVVDAETDPRSGHLTVTYMYHQAASDPDVHTQILSSALQLAQTLAARTDPRTFDTLTLRCLLLSPPPSGAETPAPVSGQIIASTPLAFVADVARAQIPNANFLQAMHTDQELTAVFSDVWWKDGMS